MSDSVARERDGGGNAAAEVAARRERRHRRMAERWFRARGRLRRQLIYAVVVLAAGYLGREGLIALQKPTELQSDAARGPLVAVRIAEARSAATSVRGYGTARAKVQVEIVPQVSGRVVALHRELANGEYFQAGQTLLAIEADDYELAVKRAEADLRQASAVRTGAAAHIDDMGARWADAQRERDRIEGLLAEGVAKPRELEKAQLALDVADAARRTAQSQMATAEASRLAAKAALARAQLDLDRTRITAPFDGRIVEERVDVGQYVVAGQAIATVYSTDTIEVPIPLETRELAWFDLQNGRAGDQKYGANVTLSADYAGARHTWRGCVVRSEGQVDPDSRMVHVVVEVIEAFGRSDRPDLVPGMFVEAAIEGRTLDGAIAVERHAIRGNDQVWVVRGGEFEQRHQKPEEKGKKADKGKKDKNSDTDDEVRITVPREAMTAARLFEVLNEHGQSAWTLVGGEMHIVPVRIARQDRDFAYVISGLSPGDYFVTSPMDAPSDEMLVRASFRQPTSADGSADTVPASAMGAAP